ncbi:XRE family transcriptional regulator [Clostridiales bacterium]|nr:XRE family transcriptional regulator [Clostridiales bacterium]
MDNMGMLIKKLRTEQGMTLEDLGNKVGVGKSTVRKWENGVIANMRRDKIAKVATALNVSPAYLMGWEDADNTINSNRNLDISDFDNIYPIETKRIPLLGDIACGQPIYANEDRESYVLAGTDIDADFCLKAKGDSMIGARINDGDIVFIKKQDIVENGEIAAVIIDDEATLKRVYYERDRNRLMLQAENPKYRPYAYEGEELDHIRILGKAIAFQSDII